MLSYILNSDDDVWEENEAYVSNCAIKQCETHESVVVGEGIDFFRLHEG